MNLNKKIVLALSLFALTAVMIDAKCQHRTPNLLQPITDLVTIPFKACSKILTHVVVPVVELPVKLFGAHDNVKKA